VAFDLLDHDASPSPCPRMAEPVTRHAQNPMAENFQFLLCGIDSLDLGLYVTWGKDWLNRLQSFDRLKQEAQEEKGLLSETVPGRSFLVYPNGKGVNFRYHFAFPEYHLYIGKSAQADKSPNVYVSINAQAHWLNGLPAVLAQISEDIVFFGGYIDRFQTSRCDLCADFKLRGGLTFDFLQAHKVSRSKKTNPYFDLDDMETFYVGAKSAPVQLRIYNKGLEVQRKGVKLWFGQLWEDDSFQDVWRVEFQLRRAALKSFQINSVEELNAQAGGVWKNLTGHWFSLRLPDNDKPERRTLHPWWNEVQTCAARFGQAEDLKRCYGTTATASTAWLVSHMDGCLSSYGARIGIWNRQRALTHLGESLTLHASEQEFTVKCQKKALILGQGQPREVQP